MCKYINTKLLALLLIFTAGTTMASVRLPGDYTGDCIVDIEDLQVLSSQWLTTENLDEQGLIAYWKFDETSGETLLETISGAQTDLFGEPEWQPTNGIIDGALYFDGIDDYSELPNNLNINGTSPRTCTAWVKCDQDLHSFFLTWGNSNQPGTLWTVGAIGSIPSQPETSWQLGLAIGGTPIYSKSHAGINDGLWHHIAVVLPDTPNPTSENVRMYIDGVETQTYYNQAISIDTSPVDTIQIGQCPDRGAGWSSMFKGSLDELRIYDRALSSQEISNIFNYGNSNPYIINRNTDPVIDNIEFSYLSTTWNQQISPVIVNEFLADNESDTPPDTSSGQILDGLGDSSDWIELYNFSNQAVDLSSWTLTDDEDKKDKWAFPQNTTIEPNGYLLVFASKKEQKDYPGNYPFIDPQNYLHTNFSLSKDGEFLGLYDSNGQLAHAYKQVYYDDDNNWGYPEQEENISFGMFNDIASYFATPTPSAENKPGYLSELDKPKFSHKRGFYSSPFQLELTSDINDAVIRYTTDGSNPTSYNGEVYAGPIDITGGTYEGICIRAIATKIGHKTSSIGTNTYIFNPTTITQGLPAISLTGESGEVFFYPNGVMAVNGGSWSSGTWRPNTASDYNYMMMHGMDYERPVSYEWINNEYDENFQEDCGLRVHGSAWMRPRYTIPPVSGTWSGSSKISQRLYFRGQYGSKNLEKTILEKFPEADKFDALVVRAGHNDISNPFIRDEMLRRVHYRMGHASPRGTFANLFINGDFKGYFNPCERINEDFCQMVFDSDLPWDIVGWVQPDNVLEARDGDTVAFKNYIQYVTDNDLSDPIAYSTAANQLDVVSFIDYLIVQSWSGNWDWPQNNWSAASERSTTPKWHFFIWDGEGGMDNSQYQNRLNELNSGGHDLAKLYRGLKDNEDFRQLFSDRLQKHFYKTNGWMQQDTLKETFWELADEVSNVIPSINLYIPNLFIPTRENIFIDQCIDHGLFTFKAPTLLFDGSETDLIQRYNPITLTIENAAGHSGTIYYTLNGVDPRLSKAQRNESHKLVAEDAPKKVFVPKSNIGTTWRGLPQYEPYDDSTWVDGLPVISDKTGGVGYEINQSSGSSNTPYISYDILDEMRNQNTCAYVRIPFEITDQNYDQWNFLTLKMRYDDGFAAYINGQKVAQVGISGDPSWNSTSSSHENYGLESFSISEHLDKLQYGTNILAIHGINTSISSSDFVVSTILEGGFSTNDIISPSAIQYASAITLDKSATIKARTLNNGQWSSLVEAKCMIGSINDNLRISEIMYNPQSDPNEEYIEFTNIGSTIINLNGCSITNGVDFTFPDTTLAPGDFAIVVANTPIFTNKYGSGLPVIGQYTGRLADSGEKLTVRNIVGNKIQSVDFNDDWYEITDSLGFSLTTSEFIAPDVTNSLQNRYHFNELRGNTIADQVGQQHAQLIGYTPSTRIDGAFHNCLRFDGYNDTISMPQGIMSSLNDFTFSCWIKIPFDYKPVRILECFADVNNTIKISANLHGYYNFTIVGPSNTASLTSQAKTNTGEWVHFAITKTGTTCTMYEDGELIGQSDNFDLSPADISVTTTNWIGHSNNSSVAHFDGWMDEVRFYNTALSQEDISILSEKDYWDNKSTWRPSAIKGGTPGRAETTQEQVPALGSVVFNEILSHSHAALPDWIELKNITSQDIDISGWYISDSDETEADRMKYQIPANTILTPGSPYYAIEESRFNNQSDPQCITPFAISEGGETLYLQSGNGGVLTGYYEDESFGASESNVSFGRYQKSTGSWNFVPMSYQTQGTANAYPKVGPLIITEIMYNPANDNQDLEYIELTNISTNPIVTASYATTYLDPDNTQSIDEWIPWKFTEGIVYEFPSNLVLMPGQSMLLVRNMTEFTTQYSSLPPSTVIYEWENGGLANDGEKLEISIPGDKEYNEDRFYIRTDRVSYDDRSPWPLEADGVGKSLTHLRPSDTGNNYTNDPVNWHAADPTPAVP